MVGWLGWGVVWYVGLPGTFIRAGDNGGKHQMAITPSTQVSKNADRRSNSAFQDWFLQLYLRKFSEKRRDVSYTHHQQL